ncbi:hypothetical protein CaCOL14_004476 [Colletotrichum acutatum]
MSHGALSTSGISPIIGQWHFGRGAPPSSVPAAPTSSFSCTPSSSYQPSNERRSANILESDQTLHAFGGFRSSTTCPFICVIVLLFFFDLMDLATPPLLNGRQEGQLTAQLSNPSQSSNVVNIPDPDPHRNATGLAIVKLEDILISARESLLQSREISIPFRTRPSTNRSASNHGPSRTTRLAVRFPGRTVEEATKFTRIMRIMQLSLSALTEGRLITKRNIYYQDTDLFKRQSIVDNLVDDLAFTLSLGREDLGIVAASKGLVSGPIILRSRTSEVDASSSEHGVLIPSARSVSEIDFGPAQWVLVIEKEATYRTLASARY